MPDITDPNYDILLEKIAGLESDLAKAKEENVALASKIDKVVEFNRTLLKQGNKATEDTPATPSSTDALNSYLKKKGL